MNEFLDARELKEQVSLIDLLRLLGYKPVKRSGKEQFYNSMIREGDKTPSFCVNDELGVWFDHGLRKGGNIIDFGMAYWKQLTFNEVVEKIQVVCSIEPAERINRPRKVGKPVKVPHYIIEEVKDLGTHPAITDYLKGRKIFEAGKMHLSEIYYYVEIQGSERKHFFAAGWKNEVGGWEVRNRYFKGCLGPKGISFVAGHPKELVVFEGFLNYLSWKTQHPESKQSIIILNSLSLMSPGLEKAREFSAIDVYLDRDYPGHQATVEFLKALPYATDRSPLYAGFNDYNDKLIADLAPKATPDPFERRPKVGHSV